jgi:hypothetical protein
MNESVRPRLTALKSTMTGNEYADRIAAYILRNFGARGLMVYREVSLGKTIIGKNRHVDIFVVHPQTGRAFAGECKYQDSVGTVDEKIPYAIQDMQAMGMPVCLAYAGVGFPRVFCICSRAARSQRIACRPRRSSPAKKRASSTWR